MILWVMPFFLIGQIFAPKDTLVIDSLISIAATQLNQKDLDKSRQNAIVALNASRSLEDWDRWYLSYERLAYVYFYRYDFDSLLHQSQHHLNIIKEKPIDPVKMAKMHGWVGFASFYTGDNDLYFKSNLESVRIHESVGKADQAIPAYINVGVCYTMKGDFKNAQEYLHQAEIFAQDQNKEKHYYSIWSNLGTAYWALKSFDKAIEYYEKANTQRPMDFGTAIKLAMCYWGKSDVVNTQKYMDLSKSLIRNNADRFMHTYQQARFIRLEDKSKSLELVREAIAIGDTLPEINRDLAKCYLLKADLELENDRTSEAKSDYLQALNLLDSMVYQQVNGNLEKAEINQLSILNGPWIMESLYGLSRAAMNETKTTDNLGYEYFALCFDAIDFIRLNYNSEESSLILGDYARKIYQSAMRYACDMDAENQSTEKNDFIITCLERSRSFLLSANLNDLEAKKIAKIPDSLLSREKILQKQITAYNSNENTVTGSEYFGWVRELEKLTTFYRKNYPTYYELTHTTKNFKLEHIQSSYLKPNQAVIYHFEMPDVIYQIGITKDDFVVETILKNEALLQNCNIYNKLLSKRNNFSDYEKNYKNYTHSAHYLYVAFLSNFLKKSGERIDELIFLPNGITHQIVFEALLERTPAQNQISYNLTALDYLLERYSISYVYAINLNRAERGPMKYAEPFVGLAPKFDAQFDADQRGCTPDKLFNLKHSESEVLEIQNTMGGMSYTKEAANKATFLRAMEEAKVVHLATHACVDELSSDQHKIYFSNDDYLSSAELYNVSSQAQMVVLSACETGLGQYHSGEGVLSLARTFAYTGIPSVVMSLWSLPDRSTSDVMKYFYEELKTGKPKHTALQQAKLNYIQQADAANQHPHYWAALVLIGDSKPIETSWSPYLIWAGILLILVFALFIYLKNYHK